MPILEVRARSTLMVCLLCGHEFTVQDKDMRLMEGDDDLLAHFQAVCPECNATEDCEWNDAVYFSFAEVTVGGKPRIEATADHEHFHARQAAAIETLAKRLGRKKVTGTMHDAHARHPELKGVAYASKPEHPDPAAVREIVQDHLTRSTSSWLDLATGQP